MTSITNLDKDSILYNIDMIDGL